MEEKEKEKELRIDEAPFNSRKHLKLLHLYIEFSSPYGVTVIKSDTEIRSMHKGPASFRPLCGVT